ncbi:hypothetical protein, partial [Nodularia spumigena]|uniref:hypothetical protein n=1 Tax=Nodularia spumigena TaxID=70799 RepID=UPI00232AC1EE
QIPATGTIIVETDEPVEVEPVALIYARVSSAEAKPNLERQATRLSDCWVSFHCSATLTLTTQPTALLIGSMNRICDDVKTPVETFHGTSLHLNSYLVSATPNLPSTITAVDGREQYATN